METLLNNGEKVIIGGKEYHMRRLGVRDVFKVVKIFAKVGQAVVKDLVDAGDDVQKLGFVMISAIPACENEVMELMGDLIGVKSEEFAAMPLEAIPVMIEKLAQSEDLKAFFTQAAKAMAHLPKSVVAPQTK